MKSAKTDLMRDCRTTLPKGLWYVLGAGLVVRCVLAVSSLPTLIALNVPDDAFYYFKIAQNIAAGRGSTFDGLHPTNGYHPLWMAFLVPLFGALPARPELGVNLVLVLQAGLDTATAGVVYLLAQALLSDRRWAVLATALYVFNPNTVFFQIDGMETALATLLAALLLYFSLPLEASSRGSWGQRMRMATACGLLLLARTDYIFLGALLFVYSAAKEWKEDKRVNHTLAMGAVVTLFVAPWLAWSYARFHQLVQVSGLAYPLVVRQHLHGPALPVGLRLLKYQLTYEWPSQSCLFEGYFLLAGIAGFLLTRPSTKPPTRERGLRVLQLAWAALFITVVFHCLVRLYPRPWYSALFLVVNALTISWAGKRICGLPWARRGVAWAMGFIFAAYGLLALDTGLQKKYPWQVEFARAAEWISVHTSPEARIGAFNAGILGFLSHRTVVDLDGSVNNSAYEALRARRLHDYLLANSISYVADFRWSVEFVYKQFWDNGADQIPLAQTPCFPEDPIFWKASVLQIYKVLGPVQGESMHVSPGFGETSKLLGCDDTR